MAIVVAKSGEDIGARDVSADDQGKETARRRFKIFLDDADIDGFAVITAAVAANLIPNIRDTYVVEGTRKDDLLCVHHSPTQHENPYLWFVDVEYTNQLSSDRDLVDYDFDVLKKPFEHDALGNAVVNSARQPFDPPPEIPHANLTVLVKRENETAYDRNLAKDFMFTTNSKTWFGFPPKTCLMSKIRASDRGQTDYSHRVEWHIKVADRRLVKANSQQLTNWNKEQALLGNPQAPLPNGVLHTASEWDFAFLDQGYYTLAAGVHTAIRDANGQPLSAPTLLDGSGGKLAAGADPVFRRFVGYREADFNIWRMPRGVPGGFPNP